MDTALNLTLDQFLALQMLLAMFSVFSTGFIRLAIKTVRPDYERSELMKSKLPYLSVLCGSAGALIVYFDRGAILVGGIDYGWLVHAMGGGIGGACGPMIYDQFTSKLYWMTDAALDKILGRSAQVDAQITTEEVPQEGEEDVSATQDDR